MAVSPNAARRESQTRLSQHDQMALSRLMPLVYDELRRLAKRYVGRERPGLTLRLTALVNEVYLRLDKHQKQGWQSRAHFVAIAALSMRQILVERARARDASKRGGDRVKVTLDEGLVAETERSVDLLAVDDELRFFGGLTVDESAEVLGISPATVKRRWALAKAWLQREITQGPVSGS